VGEELERTSLDDMEEKKIPTTSQGTQCCAVVDGSHIDGHKAAITLPGIGEKMKKR
jgi:hypothetical protein